ncbi:PRD domain-containing protein [Thermaerobacter composti]|uniref:PRD domain-containing protein n=1 Tax=Thermaerobacter composti TaxID=554949 RepID=A0ABZ0QNS8_9FIRM|nr:PRD domain-containing protein [Thermaerobacter composti]WPD18422.1 PRD domain-containing protein [Thermaerobacter composti]
MAGEEPGGRMPQDRATRPRAQARRRGADPQGDGPSPAGHGAYRVVKVLNNNAVLVRDAAGRTLVLEGRGLGFRARKAAYVAADDPAIEATYAAGAPGVPVPPWLPGLVAQLVERAEAALGEPVDPHIVPALLDHLAFAVQRVRRGLPLENPFLAEIEVLFPEELALARQVLAEVVAAGGPPLPPDEAGFVALHLRAARARVPVKEPARSTALVHDLVEWVRRRLGVALRPGGLDHARLVAHLRYLVDAVARGGGTPNPLLPRIAEEFPEAMALARELGEEIARRLGKPVQPDDLGYVALHLAKLMLDGGAAGPPSPEPLPAGRPDGPSAPGSGTTGDRAAVRSGGDPAVATGPREAAGRRRPPRDAPARGPVPGAP